MGFDPYYNYGMADFGSTVGMIFLVMIGIYLLVFLFAAVAYVLESLGVYTIAMRRGIKHPWLAWLPYGNMWILGSVADQYQFVSHGQVKNRRKIMLGLQIAASVLWLAIFGIYIYVMLEVMINAGSNFNNIATDNMAIASVIAVVMGLAIYVLGILLVVFRYISLYNLFASCWPDCKVPFLLLSIFIGVTEPFLVFACRKKDLGMPPRKTECVASIEPPAPVDPPAPAEPSEMEE